jgi:hypothetical protein
VLSSERQAVISTSNSVKLIMLEQPNIYLRNPTHFMNTSKRQAVISTHNSVKLIIH